MKQHIEHVAFIVDEYDEAISFYTEKLNFGYQTTRKPAGVFF
jgi:catechol 2,3-dioxygenase-like lactoylglutathione lyase family enzyme